MRAVKDFADVWVFVMHWFQYDPHHLTHLRFYTARGR